MMSLSYLLSALAQPSCCHIGLHTFKNFCSAG